LLVSAEAALAAALRARAGERLVVVESSDARGCGEVDEAELAAEVADAAAGTIVFQCRGEADLPRAFFSCRAIAQSADREVSLVILDLDLEEDIAGALATLADGLVKAFRTVRVALLSNRIPERLRPSRGDLRAAWQPAAVAAAIANLNEDSSWRSGQRVVLGEAAAER